MATVRTRICRYYDERHTISARDSENSYWWTKPVICWTEVDAQRVVCIQNLLTTCRLQGVDTYVDLVN